MSDQYEVDGVKITPQGGGVYQLEHPSLEEPVSVRGKEKADARAAEIAKAAKPAEDRIEQGELPDDIPGTATITPPPAPASMTTPDVNKHRDDPDYKPPVQETPTDEQGAPIEQREVDQEDEVAKLKARIAELEAAGVRTVAHDGGSGVSPGLAQKMAPQQYTGPLEPELKKALEKVGITTTRIVLEENESIPPTGLFIGHNGRGYMIKPGEEVDVPDFLLGVLRDAVTSTPITDSKTMKVLGYRDRMKYPFREVK